MMTAHAVRTWPWRATRFGVMLAVVASLLSFLVWKDSYTARDGLRYFAIDDDALISMRYAWNLAHGQGLVWNAGEHVEGITNPLWTLYAAAWATVTPRRLLPLVIQISGIMALLEPVLNRPVTTGAENRPPGPASQMVTEIMSPTAITVSPGLPESPNRAASRSKPRSRSASMVRPSISTTS